MTKPISAKPAVTTKGYAQANLGIIQNAAGENYTNIGATLGVQANYKNTYMKGEAGAGTALTGKIELGHEFDIGKNMGLDLSAKGQYSRAMQKSSFHAEVQEVSQTSQNGVVYTTKNGATIESRWHASEMRLGTQAELTFKTKRAKFGVGVEGGMRRSGSTDIHMDYVSTDGLRVTIDKNLNKKLGYVTPTFDTEIQLGRKSNFSFVANADRFQGQAGIRYTF